MDDVNIGLFERDWNNTLYFFALNADERIYLRYGGRDSRSQDTYLNLDSLELALAKGLELHRLYLAGRLPKTETPAPMYPRQIPLLVERTFAKYRCVECHLIGDFQNLERERNATLDKVTDLFRSPDIRTLGIELDIPRGLAVKQALGAAGAAGMRSGDVITSLEGSEVWTFGDFQYRLDKVRRDADQIALTVDRDGTRVPLTISLPERWWWTDLTFRQSSVDPRVYFESRPLSSEEKQADGFDRAGFAGIVTRVDMFAEVTKSHELRVGDIVFAVDGVERDPVANTPELFIKLRRNPGNTVILGVLRGGRRIEMPLKTYQVGFRK